MTDRADSALTACDLLGLYLGRGGFEGTLAQEDREQDADRWVSTNAEGQELWQLICLTAWNSRVRLGRVVSDPPRRRTVWSEALPQAPGSESGAVLLAGSENAPGSAADETVSVPRGARIAAARGAGQSRRGRLRLARQNGMNPPFQTAIAPTVAQPVGWAWKPV
ncbi:MAG: hypothetical protein HYV63_01140 [Candidatus Schekmanbacteria bacterium]|nr:hypothetical protein [Candidatus Schekmanbacteria bacterium]